MPLSCGRCCAACLSVWGASIKRRACRAADTASIPLQRPLSSLGQGLALCMAVEGQWQVVLASSSWSDMTATHVDSDGASLLTDNIRLAGASTVHCPLSLVPCRLVMRHRVAGRQAGKGHGAAPGGPHAR